MTDQIPTWGSFARVNFPEQEEQQSMRRAYEEGK